MTCKGLTCGKSISFNGRFLFVESPVFLRFSITALLEPYMAFTFITRVPYYIYICIYIVLLWIDPERGSKRGRSQNNFEMFELDLGSVAWGLERSLMFVEALKFWIFLVGFKTRGVTTQFWTCWTWFGDCWVRLDVRMFFVRALMLWVINWYVFETRSVAKLFQQV